MNARLVLWIAAAGASQVFGQSIQVRPTNLSALTSEHVSTVTVECAISGNAVFGGQIALELETHDIRVATAASAVAFASKQNESKQSAFRFKANQSLGRLDPTLGSNAESVPFATIELEIPHNRPFKSGVWISGSVTQIGGQPIPATMEFVGEQPEGGGVITSGDGKRLFIPIRRIAPEPPPSTEIPIDLWTTDIAPLSVSIHPAGGGAAVTTLTAGSAYDLHYDAGQNQVGDYVLFFAGGDPSHSVSAIARPGSGKWADTGFFSAEFVAVDASAEGGMPDGFQRNAQVFDMQTPGGDRAASSGHLLNFTPQTTGPLGIELYMHLLDPDLGRSIEMQKSLVLDVRSAE